jgi:transcription initiation factor IIF auxiliary subunit
MIVTANQLHVSASNRPSSGCTFKEKGWGLYNIQCDFYLMTRSRSSYHIHIHYSQVKQGRTKYVGKVMEKTNE